MDFTIAADLIAARIQLQSGLKYSAYGMYYIYKVSKLIFKIVTPFY